MNLVSKTAASATALGLCAMLPFAALGAEKPDSGAAVTAGRWVSSDNVSSSGTAKAGARFFLDITVSSDGSFKGTWEEFVCFNYPGAYGVAIVSCQRSRKPSSAAGRLDSIARTGTIDLQRLGKTPFRFKTVSNQKGQPQLDIELPRDWLKQGDAVLYETSLNPRSN